jgi:threonine/homoserine/homoserine lactone efflux protein
MIRHWPLFLLGLGLVVVVVGFFYDVSFAGIPYQDPTPEMSARYAHQSRIASRIYSVGGVALLFGAIAAIIQLILRRLSRLRAS